MLRILRAFAWLRWRILVNSLERSTNRDIVERFSAAIEQLGPAIAALMMVPSAIGLAGAAAFAGWALAQGQSEILVLSFLRFILFAGWFIGAFALAFLPKERRYDERSSPLRVCF